MVLSSLRLLSAVMRMKMMMFPVGEECVVDCGLEFRIGTVLDALDDLPDQFRLHVE
jgi:hypothetical protein